MKNNTNGIVGAVQRSHVSDEIKSELYEVLKANSIRGESSYVAKNPPSYTVGAPLEEFKFLDDKTDFKSMKGSALLFGFYSGEKNIGSSNSNYYCAIDGHIENKKELGEKYGIDLRFTDVHMILKLYVVLKSSYPNDYIEAVRQFGDFVLKNHMSVILQDRLTGKMIAFTNKYLFCYTNPSNYVVLSSELPSTFETKYAKLDSNVAYMFNMESCHLEERVQLKINRYRNNFMLKNPGIFFDGSLESAVSLYVCSEMLHSRLIHVGCLNKSIAGESFLRYASEKLEIGFEGYFNSFESFVSNTYEYVDTYVDCLNVDSVGRSFSDSYLYKNYVDIYTMGNTKYIDLFKYMSLPEIIQLGYILNVPFDKIVSCENPVHYGTLTAEQIESIKDNNDLSNVFVVCGECEMCKRNVNAFALAGIEDPHVDKYVKKLEPNVKSEKAIDLNSNVGELLSKLRVKVLSTIEL